MHSLIYRLKHKQVKQFSHMYTKKQIITDVVVNRIYDLKLVTS